MMFGLTTDSVRRLAFQFAEKSKKSKQGDGWIKCVKCHRWVHDACAGVEEDEESFVCDYCLT